MALTIVKRPQWSRIIETSHQATVTNSAGDALFTSAGHGLTDGFYVWITSTRGSYNGYWYVDIIDANTFKIREYATADAVLFVNTGSVTYYQTSSNTGLNNDWSAVHLPIVYKIKSDKWPTNSVDTARTVSSFSNSNGYTSLILSGDIKASGSADALEQVVIAGTASLDGVYKILSWSSDVNFVIDLSYSATNSFSGGTIQYYYGNYHAVIKIYAGLPSTHYWASYKPYELVGTITQQPDLDGLVIVNVNEFVKKQISIATNNLMLDTLPNNLDAFTGFYISVAESYDDANQYGTNDLNVSQYTSAFTDDTVLYAVNADLPFKTQNFLTAYTSSGFPGTTAQKWLTGFTQPVLFVGKYFDISWISNATTTRTITRKVYSSADVLLGTFLDVQTNMNVGVYRYPIEQSVFLEAYITIQITNPITSELLRIDVNSDCSAQDFYVTWLNSLGGYDYWNFLGETQYGTDIIESKTQKKNIYTNWPDSYSNFAESVTNQTRRVSNDNITLNSQYIDSTQMDGLSLIVESILVQEFTSVYDKRTIIIDSSSFPRKVDNQKLLMATIQARYTDENPSQSL